MSGPEQALTPGKAAYLATVTQAVIDGHGIGKYPAYDQLEPWQRGRWEAAAQAVIEAAPPRVITCDHSPAELGVTVDGSAETAVVTAGTEHLVPLIRGLAIPDEL